MYIKKYPYEGARLFGKVKKVTYIRIATLSEFILLCRVQNFIKIPIYIQKELIVPFGRSNQSEIIVVSMCVARSREVSTDAAPSGFGAILVESYK